MTSSVQNKVDMSLIIDNVRQHLARHVETGQGLECFQLEPLKQMAAQHKVQACDIDKAYAFLVHNQDLLEKDFTPFTTIAEKLIPIQTLLGHVVSMGIGDQKEITNAVQILGQYLIMEKPIETYNIGKGVEASKNDSDKTQILLTGLQAILPDLKGKEEEEGANKLIKVLTDYDEVLKPLEGDKKKEVVERTVRISNGILDAASQADLRNVLELCDLNVLDKSFRTNKLEEELKQHPRINTEGTLREVLKELKKTNSNQLQSGDLDKIDTLMIKIGSMDLNLAEFREVDKRLESHSKSPDAGINQLIASFKTELMKRDVLSEYAKLATASEPKSMAEANNIICKFMKDSLGDKYDSLSKVDKQLLTITFSDALDDAVEKAKAAPAKPVPDPAKAGSTSVKQPTVDVFTSTVSRGADLVIPLPDGFSVLEENGKLVMSAKDEGIREVTAKLSDDKRKLIIDSQKATKDGTIWFKGKYTKDGKTEDKYMEVKVKFEEEANKIPIIGMIASGVVGLLGLLGISKSDDDDKKKLSWGATILGLAGLGGFGYWFFKPVSKEQSAPQKTTAEKIPA